MKKSNIGILVLSIILILGVIFLLLISRGSEDSWIKDKRGVWIKRGNPSNLPDEVVEQHDVIGQAVHLYEIEKQKANLSSQCLGTVYFDKARYAVDIVHVPRAEEDDLPENQCQEFRAREVSHFIELDKDGNIVEVV